MNCLKISLCVRCPGGSHEQELTMSRGQIT